MFAEYVDGLRATIEATHEDHFAAYAPSGWATADDGYEAPAWSPKGEVFGKVVGRSRESATNTRVVTVGGVERPVIEGGLEIGIDDPLPEIGWEYVCTHIGPATDPALLGRRWRVVDVPAKSYATARRLDVVEVPA